MKHAVRVLTETALDLYNILEDMAIWTILVSSIQKQGIYFHFLMSSSVKDPTVKALLLYSWQEGHWSFELPWVRESIAQFSLP